MIDPLSATWRETKEEAERVIERATASILMPGCDPRDADFHRGRISAMRDVLRLETALGKVDQQPSIGSLVGY